MREIKFRYAFKRKEDGHIFFEIVPIECLEGDGDTPFIHWKKGMWELIGRDEYVGSMDRNGKEICEGDLIKVVGAESGEMIVHVDDITNLPLSTLYPDGEIVGNIYTDEHLLHPDSPTPLEMSAPLACILNS